MIRDMDTKTIKEKLLPGILVRISAAKAMYSPRTDQYIKIEWKNSRSLILLLNHMGKIPANKVMVLRMAVM